MLGAMLLSAINLAYYQALMAGCARRSKRRIREFRAARKRGWAQGVAWRLKES